MKKSCLCKKTIRLTAFIIMLLLLLTSCAGSSGYLNGKSLNEIIAAAKKEGTLNSLAMPDSWANWGDTWDELEMLYGIKHTDKDCSSVTELELFERGIGDIGDVGFEYGSVAEKRNLTMKYKTSYWDEIPLWAKDNDGDWIVCYTGTLAFMINNDLINGEAPETWNELLNGDYKVGISDVLNASLGQYTVYIAALANGGDINNIQPGIDFFKTLAEQGRLVTHLQGFDDSTDDSGNIIHGAKNSGAGVCICWDFVALQYRDIAHSLEQPISYSAVIPDYSVTVGYASIINSKAKNPYSAALAREYILSDEGQINLARGYATPIRNVRLPDDVVARRIPESQYNKGMITNALQYNEATANMIIKAWNEQIVPLIK